MLVASWSGHESRRYICCHHSQISRPYFAQQNSLSVAAPAVLSTCALFKLHPNINGAEICCVTHMDNLLQTDISVLEAITRQLADSSPSPKPAKIKNTSSTNKTRAAGADASRGPKQHRHALPYRRANGPQTDARSRIEDVRRRLWKWGRLYELCGGEVAFVHGWLPWARWKDFGSSRARRWERCSGGA